jgi:acetyl-CoA carboxylase carboxyl transferase subunit alpha
MATYLDFEKNIQKIEEDLIGANVRNDVSAIEILNDKLQKEVTKVYTNLSDYQKLQLARHVDRPYAMDYIKAMLTDPVELHGDRHYKDDNAIVCFMGFIGEQKVVIIGEEKGRGTKNKLKRNFGMPQPEGYRKALRVARMAEKFDIPILFLIDTAGAYPGIGAEERNQSEAIAKNLLELSDLNTTIISVVIGEGGSGGALAIGVADKLAMMRYSVFSVISPEGCAAILWNDPSKVETATNALKITPNDLLELGVVDDIIDEPLIGAHRDKNGAIKSLQDYFLNAVEELAQLSSEDRLAKRYEKIMKYGKFGE